MNHERPPMKSSPHVERLSMYTDIVPATCPGVLSVHTYSPSLLVARASVATKGLPFNGTLVGISSTELIWSTPFNLPSLCNRRFSAYSSKFFFS